MLIPGQGQMNQTIHGQKGGRMCINGSASNSIKNSSIKYCKILHQSFLQASDMLINISTVCVHSCTR